MNQRTFEALTLSLHCVWLTGLPCAGKSTLARALSAELDAMEIRNVVLDADELRRSLNADLDFSRAARTENARRLAEVARLFLLHGTLPIVAAISPYRSDRELARKRLQPFPMLEVFVSAPAQICIERDVKGLYAQALQGRLSGLVGVDVEYETSPAPDLTIATHHLDLNASVATALAALIRSDTD